MKQTFLVWIWNDSSVNFGFYNNLKCQITFFLVVSLKLCYHMSNPNSWIALSASRIAGMVKKETDQRKPILSPMERVCRMPSADRGAQIVLAVFNCSNFAFAFGRMQYLFLISLWCLLSTMGWLWRGWEWIVFFAILKIRKGQTNGSYWFILSLQLS